MNLNSLKMQRIKSIGRDKNHKKYNSDVKNCIYGKMLTCFYNTLIYYQSKYKQI